MWTTAISNAWCLSTKLALALTLCLPRLRLVLDFNLLVYAFGKIPLVVCTWICMFLSALLVPFTLFHLWSHSQSGSHGYPRMYSLLFASLYLLYQGLGLGFLPMYVVVTNSLPPASCFIVILEQVRGDGARLLQDCFECLFLNYFTLHKVL